MSATLAERVAQRFEARAASHLHPNALTRFIPVEDPALAKLVRAGQAQNIRMSASHVTPWDAALRELAAALGVEVDNG